MLTVNLALAGGLLPAARLGGGLTHRYGASAPPPPSNTGSRYTGLIDPLIQAPTRYRATAASPAARAFRDRVTASSREPRERMREGRQRSRIARRRRSPPPGPGARGPVRARRRRRSRPPRGRTASGPARPG